MALDFEWLSNNLDIAYPFRTPAPVFDLGGVQRSLGNIMADAAIYTSIEDDAQWKLYSFNLTFDWPNPPTAGVVRVKSDLGHDIVLNGMHTDTTFNAWIYGQWLVTEWVKVVVTPAGFSDFDIVVRLLWAKAELEACGSLSKSETDWGDPAWFEDNTVRQGPRRVRRAFYKVGDFYFPLGKELQLANGFNTELVIKQAGDAGFRADLDAAAAVRPETTLLLSMPPGGGTGKYLRCEPQGLLRTINGLGPDARGNFHFSPKDCYWLERPLATDPVEGGDQVDKTATVYPNRLQLHNACEECCSCADYVEVYENLQRLWAMAKAASASIYDSLESYKGLRDEYLLRTKGGRLIVKAGLVSSPGFSLNVAALIVNGSDEPVVISDEVIVKLNFAAAPDEFNTGYVDKTGLIGLPSSQNKSIDPESTDTNKFELELSGIYIAPGQQVLWTGQFAAAPGATLSRNASNITVSEHLWINGVQRDSDSHAVELKPFEERA